MFLQKVINLIIFINNKKLYFLKNRVLFVGIIINIYKLYLLKTNKMTKIENKILEPIDYTELLGEYSNMWVVLSFDEKEVLKVGKTYEELLDFVEKGITMFIPDLKYAYAP